MQSARSRSSGDGHVTIADRLMTDEPVLLKVEGAIATIAFNRPEARNAMLRGMGGSLCAKLKQVETDLAIRVIILRGVGKDFCPGADLKAPSTSGPMPPPDLDAYEAAVLLHEMPQVTIAAVRGGCAGAGFGYACACDLRVGDETSRFNSAFLDAGVAGDMGVPWSLPRLVGAGRARDLMVLPRKFDGKEALEIGLLQHLFDANAFEDRLAELATRLADSAPLALRTMKANFLAAESLSFADYVRAEAQEHIRLLDTEDRVEAFRAIIEKRDPNFVGR